MSVRAESKSSREEKSLIRSRKSSRSESLQGDERKQNEFSRDDNEEKEETFECRKLLLSSIAQSCWGDDVGENFDHEGHLMMT